MKLIIKNILFIFLIASFIPAYCEMRSEKAKKLYANDDVAYLKEIEDFKRMKKYMLIRVAGDKKVNIVKALIKAGAKVNIKGPTKLTPLHKAAMGNDLEVAKILIEHGAKVNAKGELDVVANTSRRKTPLHMAASYGHIDMVKLLLENKAKLEAKDYIGRTPLMYAIESKNLELIRYLLEYGADVTVRTKRDNKSVLHKAGKSNEIIIYLLAYGAFPLMRDKKGNLSYKNRNQWMESVLKKADTYEIRQMIKNKKHDEVINILKKTEKEAKILFKEELKKKEILAYAKRLEKSAIEFNSSVMHRAVRSRSPTNVINMITLGYSLQKKDQDGLLPIEYTDTLHSCPEKWIIRSILDKAQTEEIQALIKSKEEDKIISILTKTAEEAKNTPPPPKKRPFREIKKAKWEVIDATEVERVSAPLIHVSEKVE